VLATASREFLKSTLSEKSKNREGYSLRAFSLKIGFSNSFLSEVLSGKKSLSVEAAFKIAVKLDLTETESQYFCLLVQLDQEKDPMFRAELMKRLEAINPKRKSHDLSVDLFKTISEWYHFAILELSYLPDFKLDAGYISKRLNIQKIEAELAIERLKRLELIEKDDTGRYKKAHNYVLTQSRLPNEAFRIHHQQILEKAMNSLKNQKPDERMSATDIVAFDSKYMGEVERLSIEFSSGVMRLAEKSKTKDRVGALSVHFFNLTILERKGNRFLMITRANIGFQEPKSPGSSLSGWQDYDDGTGRCVVTLTVSPTP
jgi:uncharacterized protein (TIGR02147 family)